LKLLSIAIYYPKISMIETNNPAIDIEELEQRVQEEVARCNTTLRTRLAPHLISSKELVFNRVETFLACAESRVHPRMKWPDKLNRFPLNASKKIQKVALKALEIIFIDQREVNFNFLQALRELLPVNRQLVEQTKSFQVQTEVLEQSINTVNEQISKIDDRFRTIDEHIDAIDNLVCTDNKNGRVPLEECLSGIDNRFVAADERIKAIDDRFAAIEARFSALDYRLSAIDDRLSALDSRLSATEKQHARNDTYLKADLAQQKRLITLFLEQAQQKLSTSEPQLQTYINEGEHSLDAFYVAFEDRFRGLREEITERLEVYLPRVASADVGTQESPILDVGCGRGEWLDLLQQSGYIARGIDINRVMVEQCRAKGLEVAEVDVFAYLKSLPEASLGAVTGFHIIEHLPFLQLRNLFDEVLRVLKPGGLAVFETPNPQNLLVGGCDFYSDPTHQRPLYPETIQFMMSYQGFLNVELLYLNPVGNSPFDLEDPGSRTIHNLFFGPRDYAVVGNKV
jgi:O-antigen chain-terminating methyltransferase